MLMSMIAILFHTNPATLGIGGGLILFSCQATVWLINSRLSPLFRSNLDSQWFPLDFDTPRDCLLWHYEGTNSGALSYSSPPAQEKCIRLVYNCYNYNYTLRNKSLTWNI